MITRRGKVPLSDNEKAEGSYCNGVGGRSREGAHHFLIDSMGKGVCVKCWQVRQHTAVWPFLSATDSIKMHTSQGKREVLPFHTIEDYTW